MKNVLSKNSHQVTFPMELPLNNLRKRGRGDGSFCCFSFYYNGLAEGYPHCLWIIIISRKKTTRFVFYLRLSASSETPARSKTGLL